MMNEIKTHRGSMEQKVASCTLTLVGVDNDVLTYSDLGIPSQMSPYAERLVAKHNAAIEAEREAERVIDESEEAFFKLFNRYPFEHFD